MAESDRQLAMRALREALRDADATPAERVRAAEALLRAQAEELGETADFLAATDAELLALARGETGGTPPERGPSDSSAGAVPSSAVQVPSAGPATRGAHAATCGEQTAEGASMGPKEDPLLANGGGPPSPLTATSNPFLQRALRGPKKDPAKGNMPPANSGQFDPKGQNGHDPDPWT